MSTYEIISIILSSVTILLAIISVSIAIISSRKTAMEAARQIKAIRLSNKKEIEHQSKVAWTIIQNYYTLNMFELSEDKNQLIIIQEELKRAQKGSKRSKELTKQELMLSYRIRNREITNENYDKLIRELKQSTTTILQTDELI